MNLHHILQKFAHWFHDNILDLWKMRKNRIFNTREFEKRVKFARAARNTHKNICWATYNEGDRLCHVLWLKTRHEFHQLVVV